MAASIIGSLPTKVQVGEKFRLDLTRTYVHSGDHNISVLTVTIDATTWDVLSDKYFDYDFSTVGEKTISVYAECAGQGHPTASKDFTIEVVSASDEKLFCTDQEILMHEPDLLEYLPNGKSSYHYIHRLVQDRILSEMDEKNILDADGNKLTAASFVDISEVNEWAKYYALMFIYNSLSNSVEDIFNEKYLRYKEYMMQARNRAVIRFDFNNDGTIEDNEEVSINSMRLVKR